jgi:hypothetical protein
MPRLSGTTLLARAIPEAIEDRIAMVDAYGGKGPEAAEARQAIDAVNALKGKRFEHLTEPERRTAFSTFVWAEQYLESLADANHNRGSVAREAARTALMLRTFRHTHMGRSRFEAETAQMIAVDVRDIRTTP